MKFISYIFDKKEDYGILSKDGKIVFPMEVLLSKLNKEVPKNLLDFVKISSDGLILDLERVLKDNELTGVSIERLDFTAPIPNPRRNVFCLGKNYIDHALEIDIPGIEPEIPEFPIYFTKVTDPAMGHMDNVLIPNNITEMGDYEVELAIIIGKDGKDIASDDAEDYIFGYSIANDISARDIQTKHNQWFKGKSFDTFTPMGPYLVHKSEIAFPIELDISCKVNGELRQHSNTKNLIFDIPYIISDLSKGLTLRAGDIILTGTPAGVGMGFNPPIYLKAEDVVECSIEKLGTLVNTIK